MFTVKIAEIPIGIDNHWDAVRFICENFLVDEKPLFTVSASIPEMETNLEKGYGVGYAEVLSIFRAISEKMPVYDALLMHAAVIALDGNGIAFAAPSGVGKTTRVQLWQKSFGKRLTVINGDKPFIRFLDDVPFVFGTPWKGKEGMGGNSSVPLKCICFLERYDEVLLKRLSLSEATARLFRQVFLPTDLKKLELSLSLIERILEKIPCFLLLCNQEKEDPEIIWTQMEDMIR